MVPSAARTLYHPREVTGLEQGARLRAARREVLDRTKDALRTAPLFFWHAEVLRLSCERMWHSWRGVCSAYVRFLPKAGIPRPQKTRNSSGRTDRTLGATRRCSVGTACG